VGRPPGAAIFGYLAKQAVDAIARELTDDTRRERRQRRMIDQLENQFTVCGQGRVGRRAPEELTASGATAAALEDLFGPRDGVGA
jgi:voltage-gated potassium channel Kch